MVMSNKNIDTTKGFHQVLSVSGEDASTVMKSIMNEQSKMNDFQTQLQSLISDGSHSIEPNIKVVDHTTGLASTYCRLVEEQKQDNITSHDFSEKQSRAFTNEHSNISAKVNGTPTKLVEVEISEFEKNISTERERLQELENQFLNIQNALIQSLQNKSPEQKKPETPKKPENTSPQGQTTQPNSEEKTTDQRTIAGTATAGHALVSGITSFLSRKKEPKSVTKPLTSPVNVWMNPTSTPLTIPEQCQKINQTINNIADSNVCNSKGVADELFKTLSKDLISLNQSMSKESRSFFAKSKNNTPKGESLLKDMGHVDEMLSNLGNKTPELNGVMDKFGVKIDMKSIKESMSTMVDQMKDILNNVMKKTTSTSMEMNT